MQAFRFRGRENILEPIMDSKIFIIREYISGLKILYIPMNNAWETLLNLK